MSYDNLDDYELKELFEKLCNERIKARQRQLSLTQKITAVREQLKRRGYTF